MRHLTLTLTLTLTLGLLGLGATKGLLGHSLVGFGGTMIIGAPIAMGILDLGILGSDSFNHTG